MNSRIKSECPFCKQERKMSVLLPSKMIEKGYGELVPVKKRQKFQLQIGSEEDNTTVFFA